MKGPIDYIAVHFKENKFDGSIMEELKKAMESGVINVLDVTLILKDKDGNVASQEIQDESLKGILGPEVFNAGLITTEDVIEVGEMLDNDSSAGLLIIEQLWAKGLKKALLDAGATLLAEGRIHPEAAEEIN